MNSTAILNFSDKRVYLKKQTIEIYHPITLDAFGLFIMNISSLEDSSHFVTMNLTRGDIVCFTFYMKIVKVFNMAGEFSARKLHKKRKHFKWKKADYKYRVLGWEKKKDPLAGAPQARGIVLEKRVVEQKQPHSGLIKCVRVRLFKTGKEVTAFAPRTGAINHISEHDQVVIEGLGGSQGGAVGSMHGVKWRVSKVNDVSLEMIRSGRKQKPMK
jgi:small subunit ribosomal protein S12